MSININNSRTDDQRSVMERIQEDKVCPFCREHFETYHTKPILFETSHWVVTENAWPYQGTKEHYLLVAKEHVTHMSALKIEAWQNLYECIARLEKEESLERGTLLMRFGDSTITGATVDHLHAQIVVGESKDTPVMTRVG